MKDLYFKTAEFAKYCNVSKQTLIYYDNFGIFHPHHVDDNSYRYYAMSQYDYFLVISMLRQLGTPLKEIKEYMENRNAEGFLRFLHNKEQEIDKKIHALKATKELIRSRELMTIKGTKGVLKDEICMRYVQKENLILSNFLTNLSDMSFMEAARDLQQYIGGIKNANAGVLIKKEALLCGDFDRVAYIYMRYDKESERSYVKQEGLYAVGYHVGTYETTKNTYAKMVRYIHNEGYEIVGDAYEDGLLDYCTEENESNYLTQISIQVKKGE